MSFFEFNRRRAIFAAILTVLGVVALTGCSTSGDAGPQPGSASNAVHITGEFGTNPTIKIDSPATAKDVECTTVIEGSGNRATEGQMITVDIGIYNGNNGELIQSTSFDGSDRQDFVIQEGLLPGLQTGFTCVKEGSRVVVAVPPKDGFGAEGNADIGISGTDTLLFVIDTHRVYLARAQGESVPADSGMPTVTLSTTGQPGVTVPRTTAPAEQKISTLMKGSGQKVKSGDTVVVHYSGFLWDDGSQFDSSWSSNTPTKFTVGDGVNDQGQVIQGFSNAIIGQTVGSQVVTVIPPGLGYGEQGTGTIPPNATLIFVVDILGVSASK